MSPGLCDSRLLVLILAWNPPGSASDLWSRRTSHQQEEMTSPHYGVHSPSYSRHGCAPTNGMRGTAASPHPFAIPQPRLQQWGSDIEHLTAHGPQPGTWPRSEQQQQNKLTSQKSKLRHSSSPEHSACTSICGWGCCQDQT